MANKSHSISIIIHLCTRVVLKASKPGSDNEMSAPPQWMNHLNRDEIGSMLTTGKSLGIDKALLSGWYTVLLPLKLRRTANIQQIHSQRLSRIGIHCMKSIVNKFRLILLFALTVILSPQALSAPISIMTFNVENLFDATHDAGKND